MNSLADSRYTAVDFLRFYWSAFHETKTTKELYRAIKEKLTNLTVVEFAKSFLESAEYFSRVTNSDMVYPSTDYDPDSDDRYYAELNSLKYSVCYPLFLRCNNDRPDLLSRLVPRTVSFLFRLITIGDFSVGRADASFTKALQSLKANETDDVIIGCLTDNDIDDESFSKKFEEFLFTDNTMAKYCLVKIHEHDYGTELVPHRGMVHLEHILPQSYAKNWSTFDCHGRSVEDWVYSLGNLTLFEKSLNKKISNRKFAGKIPEFKERVSKAEGGTAIRMTYDLHKEYLAGATEWTAQRIATRTKLLSRDVTRIWPL